MKKILRTLYTRLFVNYFTTLKACLYGFATFLLISRQINFQQWGEAIGIILTVSNLLAKDADKIVSKPGYSSSPKDDQLKP